jgi:hypothetical protein
MQSEDQLRSVYERQTMEYLYGDFASLDGLQEQGDARITAGNDADFS